MKYSIAAASTFAVAALAVKPQFLNSDFDVSAGQPFTVKFSGCDTGCTIILQNGPGDNLNDVTTLTSDATGGSATVTVDSVPSDTYNFKIVDNGSGEENYSQTFDVEGDAAASTSAEMTSTAGPTTTSAESTSTMMTSEETTSTPTSTSTTSSSAEMTTTMTTATSSGSSTTEASTTTSSEETSTSAAASATTTIPDDGVGQLNSPLGLVIGAAAAAAYLI